jgi:hypothetical protein
MQIGEGEHLKAFCEFIKSNSLDGGCGIISGPKLTAGHNGPSKDAETGRCLREVFKIVTANE